jgi:hypothetical protein
MFIGYITLGILNLLNDVERVLIVNAIIARSIIQHLRIRSELPKITISRIVGVNNVLTNITTLG